MVGTNAACEITPKCQVPDTAMPAAALPHLSEEATAPPSACNTQQPKPHDLVLQHVMFFHRHGDRSPLYLDDGTNWRLTPDDYTFWTGEAATPETVQHLNSISKVVGLTPTQPRAAVPPPPDNEQALGQLSQLGVDGLRARGRQLRQHYAKFLEANNLMQFPMDPMSVYVQSSFMSRAIQSAQSLLDGMFSDEIQSNATSADQVNSVFFIRTSWPTNRLAPYRENDVQLYQDLELILQDKQTTWDSSRKAAVDHLRQKFRELTGICEPFAMPWTKLRDLLVCRKCHGLPMPDEVTEDMLAQVYEMEAWLWYTLFRDHDECLLSFHEGVQEVYNHLSYVVKQLNADGTNVEVIDPDCRGQPKVAFFSAHDNSIVALLCALRIAHNDTVLPDYGAVVAFEVYKDPSSHECFLQVLYEGEAVPFVGHEHDTMVPFAFFESRVKEFFRA